MLLDCVTNDLKTIKIKKVADANNAVTYVFVEPTTDYEAPTAATDAGM